MIKNIAIITLALIVIAAVVAYKLHTWGDCLEENTILTCFNMLQK